MARTFEQVLAEVNAQSDPQRQPILQQIADLPRQQKAEEASLGAQKDQAFTDILDGSRRRGLGFSGIPLGEQAKFAATEYAPAVARLKTGFTQQATSLRGALADIGRNNYTTARGVFESDRAFDLAQQQAAEQRAAAARQLAAEQATAANYLQAQQPPAQLSQPTSAPAPAGPSASDQAIYSRAKSLQNIARSGDTKMLQSILNRLSKGNIQDRSVVDTFKGMLGGRY